MKNMKKILTICLLVVFVLVAFQIKAAPKPRGGGLEAPSNLEATAVSSSQIDLSWQDNSSKETGFRIERSPNGQDFSEIDEVGANVTSYSDTDLSPSTTYYYRVRAFRQTGQKTTYSDYSNTAQATTLEVAPDAPSNLSAIASTSDYVALNWQDNSDNEDGFSIERGTNGIDFWEIATTSVDVYWYFDYNVTSSVTYYYQVRAFNEVGYSGYSNVASTTVP